MAWLPAEVEEEGWAGSLVYAVLSFVVSALALIVGAIVLGAAQKGFVNVSIPSAEARACVELIWLRAWTGYGMLPIALLVASAVAILVFVFKIRGN